jgi:flagellar export protein FliJ
VKQYRFRLQRLLDLRQRTLDAAEADLARALAEATAFERRAAALEQEANAMAERSAGKASWAAKEMAAAEAWRDAVVRQRRTVLAGGQACRARIETLRKKVQQARVRVRVLESLDERRRGEWRREVDAEEELLASELFLARWIRLKSEPE